MQELSKPTLSPVNWKRVAWLEFWLCFLPPVGLWMVWREKNLSRLFKARLVVYTFLIPTLVYIALAVFLFHATDVAIQAGGGGY